MNMNEPRERRHDLDTRRTVDTAIVLSPRLGVELTARYLAKEKVNIDVALRVLTRPKERRKY
jgi:hypothetical protein